MGRPLLLANSFFGHRADLFLFLVYSPPTAHPLIISKMAPASAESASPIGIANLPNQRHKIVAKRGAGFTIMVRIRLLRLLATLSAGRAASRRLTVSR